MIHDVANTGLSQEVIDKLKNVFSLFPQINRITLFGSRAKGNYRQGSDIDLVMECNQLQFDDIMNIEQKLDDLLLPYTIDLLEINNIESEELLSHIKRIGITLYESKPSEIMR